MNVYPTACADSKCLPISLLLDAPKDAIDNSMTLIKVILSVIYITTVKVVLNVASGLSYEVLHV